MASGGIKIFNLTTILFEGKNKHLHVALPFPSNGKVKKYSVSKLIELITKDKPWFNIRRWFICDYLICFYGSNVPKEYNDLIDFLSKEFPDAVFDEFDTWT